MFSPTSFLTEDFQLEKTDKEDIKSLHKYLSGNRQDAETQEEIE